MGVTGDFAGLTDLRRRLGAISGGSGGGFRRQVNQVCAEAALKVIDDTFTRGIDPYGNPWAPLTSRSGKPLLDKGVHLRNTLNPKVTSTGFVVSTPFKGAAVHQYGATIKAKTPAGLLFRVQTGTRYTKKNAESYMGGGKNFGKSPFLKKPKIIKSWVRVMQVTIPRRQYMPEGRLGPRWSGAIDAAADTAMRNAMGAK